MVEKKKNYKIRDDKNVPNDYRWLQEIYWSLHVIIFILRIYCFVFLLGPQQWEDLGWMADCSLMESAAVYTQQKSITCDTKLNDVSKKAFTGAELCSDDWILKRWRNEYEFQPDYANCKYHTLGRKAPWCGDVQLHSGETTAMFAAILTESLAEVPDGIILPSKLRRKPRSFNSRQQYKFQ